MTAAAEATAFESPHAVAEHPTVAHTRSVQTFTISLRMVPSPWRVAGKGRRHAKARIKSRQCNAI